MSNFTAPTYHPETGEVRLADWLDDHFGRHLYGVRFHGDERVWPAEQCRQADPVALFNEAARLRDLVKELREGLDAILTDGRVVGKMPDAWWAPSENACYNARALIVRTKDIGNE